MLAQKVEAHAANEREKRERELEFFKFKVQSRVKQNAKQQSVSRVTREQHMVSDNEERWRERERVEDRRLQSEASLR